MTLVMIWREIDVPRVWIVSDSRLSRIGEVGHIKLTDCAAKILEAQLILHDCNKTPIQSKTVGFAYVGSSLVALQAYSAILPLWSRLQSSNQQVLPSIGECADHLRIFVAAYSNEIVGSGGDPSCQCILLGYDERSKSAETWLIETKRFESGVTANVERLKLRAGEINIFGSGKAQAEKELIKLNSKNSGWSREPLEMIRRSLKSDTQHDVGGGVQIGMVFSNQSFELNFDVQGLEFGASSFGAPFAEMRYRGFSFSDIGQIGSCFVFLRGIGQ